jgi:chemotaxis family two-component system response regulator Rcp1
MNRSLLLIEDNRADVRLVQECLRAWEPGVSLTVMEDGERALGWMYRAVGEEISSGDHRLPDLVLLDLNLPVVDGFGVLQAMQAHPELSAIPTIVLSSSENRSDVRRAYELTANCYIAKPRNFARWLEMFDALEAYWFKTAALPGGSP